MSPSRSAQLWQLRFELAAAPAIAAVEALLETAALSVSRFERPTSKRWQIEALFDRRPRRAFLVRLAETADLPLARIHAAPLPMRDWVAESHAKLPAIRAGRFFLHGSHFRGHPPKGSLALLVDAGLAFGTGRHETTRGCLLALGALAGARIERPLDLGCGSGVLALAMARLWRVPVLAADNDPAAVAVARENAATNGLGDLVRVVRSDGYAAAMLRRQAPFDLVAANILADPLMRLAPDLAHHLAPGGRAILSGFFVDQERALVAAHRSAGLRLERRWRLGEWSVLQLRLPAQAVRRSRKAQ